MRQPPLPQERSPRFIAELIATAVFWGLWAYLVTPLLSLLLWAGGVHVFVEQMIRLGGYEALLEKLAAYGLVVTGIVIAVGGWVFWNVRRYGERNTRNHALAPVTLAESADAAGVAVSELETLQRAKRVVLRFDEHDKLVIERAGRREPQAGQEPLPTN